MDNPIVFNLPQNTDQSITSGIYGIVVENTNAIISNNYSVGSKMAIARI